MIELAKRIDHTNLNPTANFNDINKLCTEADKYNFASVCVYPSYVAVSSNLLDNSSIKVATVIGYPFGNTFLETKYDETESSLIAGANEIDMVINFSAFKNSDYKYVKMEIDTIAKLCHKNDALLKVIIETSYHNESEKIKLCEIINESEADFIKTSTGYSSHGATIEDIILLKKISSDRLKIKASGGIRTKDFALELINVGADRLGTSFGIDIITYSDSNYLK